MGQYPEHDKLAEHMEVNWQIRNFLTFLRLRGLTDLSFDRVEQEIFTFRGVDRDAYRAETAQLVDLYGAGHVQQCEDPTREPEHTSEYLRMVKIVRTLDGLGVPVWAGRPACARYLRSAGMATPDTALFAKAVKLRKSLHGVVDQYQVRTSHPVLPGLEPGVREPVASSEPDQAAMAAFMKKLRGEDVQQED